MSERCGPDIRNSKVYEKTNYNQRKMAAIKHFQPPPLPYNNLMKAKKGRPVPAMPPWPMLSRRNCLRHILHPMNGQFFIKIVTHGLPNELRRCCNRVNSCAQVTRHNFQYCRPFRPAYPKRDTAIIAFNIHLSYICRTKLELIMTSCNYQHQFFLKIF